MFGGLIALRAYLSAANIDVYVERPFRVRERRITAEARSLHEN